MVPPRGKDGFLATNSLLGFATLLTRAYVSVFGTDSDWTTLASLLVLLLPAANATAAAWKTATARLWTQPTTLVLHGPSTRIGAVDLESKFTEAAIGNLQNADYRHFAHGRHHWLAKHGETGGVLAVITDADRELAERTLDLIPAYSPQARLAFAGGPTCTALTSPVAALRITGWAGVTRNIDLGQPHQLPGRPTTLRMLIRNMPQIRLRKPRGRDVSGTERPRRVQHGRGLMAATFAPSKPLRRLF